MTESARHRAWKNVACGCGSQTEYGFGRGKRLDCVNPNFSICGEVELNRERIPYDIRKLQAARSAGICKSPRLVVDPRDYSYARRVAKGKTVDVVSAKSQEREPMRPVLHTADSFRANIMTSLSSLPLFTKAPLDAIS